MIYTAHATFGALSATIQVADDNYNPMILTDMRNQCRDLLTDLIAAIPDNAHELTTEQLAQGLSHHQAMRRDLLQEDD